MRDARNCPLLIQMHIQPILSKVPSHHLPRRNDAMLLRQMFLAKELRKSARDHHTSELERTVSVCSVSESFFPTSLFCHSSVLLPGWLVIPGTTRGILNVLTGSLFWVETWTMN